MKKLFSLLTIIITSFLLIGTQLAFATQTGYDFGKYGDASFEPIPEWIKNTAGWWAEGKIPDTTFISALEWLIQHGIIVVESFEFVDPYDVTFAPILTDVAQQNLRHVTSTFFHVYGDLDTIQNVDGVQHWGAIFLGLNTDHK